MDQKIKQKKIVITIDLIIKNDKKKSITVFVFIVFPSYQIDNHIAIFGCGSNYRKILNIDSRMKLSTGGGGEPRN
ncbi:hypothetical protein DERF_011960 [Dermatophagoides farinae]|uniref:Uncharacterized protein n=1 Tax=Dermatophagoides farinae TaxID=6954 RepID=A0A922KZJ7_DERFA|nr:hypothetical protein DERF_011960 [Dermatophagoides farinae]